MNNDKIVVFQTFSDAIQANIVKGLLCSRGIECFLSDENIVTLNPLYNNAVGGVKLNVFEKDFNRISEILQAENQLPEAGPTEANQAMPITCPKCHSLNVSYGGSVERKFGYFDVLIPILLMIYPFSMRKVYHCFDCGNEFKNRTRK
jgi:DNA-directed RNA polymerase subunit M/transcription elongation factor TFIIS